MSTILITGATGFLGGVVVRRAAAEGAQIRALARSPEKAAPLRDLPGVEIVPGDITDADRMREVMPGCDVVIHCAAATSGPPDLQQRANVEGTRNVAAAAGAAGVRRLVHVSSIAVYGFRRQDNVITEDMPPQPGRVAYAITKTA
ncbi:MAG: NAD(P)H-binding protein, partial [Anaerolineae bacterium]|nr:NAD(P)H-binding protein [Anaerolineae bacterium]